MDTLSRKDGDPKAFTPVKFAPAPPNPVQPPLDFPHVAPAILHLIDRATERPICGASIREAWTIIPETATCPECRKQGDAAMLQWEVNNR